jgi:hypothetical protein
VLRASSSRIRGDGPCGARPERLGCRLVVALGRRRAPPVRARRRRLRRRSASRDRRRGIGGLRCASSGVRHGVVRRLASDLRTRSHDLDRRRLRRHARPPRLDRRRKGRRGGRGSVHRNDGLERRPRACGPVGPPGRPCRGPGGGLRRPARPAPTAVGPCTRASPGAVACAGRRLLGGGGVRTSGSAGRTTRAPDAVAAVCDSRGSRPAPIGGTCLARRDGSAGVRGRTGCTCLRRVRSGRGDTRRHGLTGADGDGRQCRRRWNRVIPGCHEPGRHPGDTHDRASPERTSARGRDVEAEAPDVEAGSCCRPGRAEGECGHLDGTRRSSRSSESRPHGRGGRPRTSDRPGRGRPGREAAGAADRRARDTGGRGTGPRCAPAVCGGASGGYAGPAGGGRPTTGRPRSRGPAAPASRGCRCEGRP